MQTCITIYEKDKRMKVYPISKKLQIFSDNLEVLFDVKSKALVKKDLITKQILSLSPSERAFYQKIFFKYLLGTKSWEPKIFS